MKRWKMPMILSLTGDAIQNYIKVAAMSLCKTHYR